jgi:hypothetical protein
MRLKGKKVSATTVVYPRSDEIAFTTRQAHIIDGGWAAG